MIVGQPGSGKSTLARVLAKTWDLPLYHMDQIHWQPGWVERDSAEKIRLCHAIEARQSWMFEGNFSATSANRLARADLLIWIDLPVGLRMRRVLWRSLSGLGQNRADLPEGCPERLGRGAWEFYRYVWQTRRTGRDNLARLAAGAEGQAKVRHLKSPDEVQVYSANPH